MSVNYSGVSANWQLRGDLGNPDQRWVWVADRERIAFKQLEADDLMAYARLLALIEAAAGGLLDATGDDFKAPLNRFLSKWAGREVPWIGEWRARSELSEGVLYRIYFTDVVQRYGDADGVMWGLLFRKYLPDRSKRDRQTKDIERAINLALTESGAREITLRRMYVSL